MDVPTPAVLARMPLAEAVLLLWKWGADADRLNGVFERHRGSCYEKAISFSTMVHLVADALLQHGGSGNQSFMRGRESGWLEASNRAAYGKLGRMPVNLSMGFLTEVTDSLREIFPEQSRRKPPGSLQGFSVITYDGKALKRVAKRLKALRGLSGGVLGGRALVAMDFSLGMTLAMHAHPDGDANDVRFVPALLPEVRRRVPGCRLHMADRQFCDLVQMEHFTAENDHFLVRYNAKVGFHSDHPPREGIDRQGRRYCEQWGWLGRKNHPQRRYVRQIRLFRPGEEDIVLLTDLLSSKEYPAEDLLDLYLERWGIERMFQKVTEVFGLKGLIGGTPEATIFQFAFCLLLYNQIQLVRAFVAWHQKRDFETISLEQLFVDVRRELIGWHVAFPMNMTMNYLKSMPFNRILRRLDALLRRAWSDRWIKAINKKRRVQHPTVSRGVHSCVYRILSQSSV